MAANLQSRLQLLAILAVAFILLSVPLFYQVRRDAADSKDTANSTFLSKYFREMAKTLKNKPPDDLQVEDAWQKWQDDHPNCGAACDPNGDPDGDGLTNKQEVEQGRNPNCNEEKEEAIHGKGYCAGQPDQPKPGPNQTTPAMDIVLYRKTNAAQGFQDSFDVQRVQPDFDRWNVTWSVSGYQGVGGQYAWIVTDPNNKDRCCHATTVSLLQSSNHDQQTLEGSDRPAGGAHYSIRLDAGNAVGGSWSVEIHGVRDPHPA